MTKLRVGTRVEVSGFDLAMNKVWEPAKVARRCGSWGAPPEGFTPIRFDADGAVLLVHRENFRIVDNRPLAEAAPHLVEVR